MVPPKRRYDDRETLPVKTTRDVRVAPLSGLAPKAAQGPGVGTTSLLAKMTPSCQQPTQGSWVKPGQLGGAGAGRVCPHSLGPLPARQRALRPAPGCSTASPFDAVRGHDLAIEVRALLQDAVLSPVVGVHDAEALAVTVRPLEIVEQGPHEVPAEVDSTADRRVDRGEVAPQVLNALGVPHGPCRIDVVVEGGAVLGYVHRHFAVVPPDAEQDIGEAVGFDCPALGSHRHVRSAGAL